jgi:molybdate transport system ATP-binding protein
MIDVDIEEWRGTFHLAVKFSADAPVVGLFGRSGSGKTTVVNAIAGVGKPLRGSIRVNGHVLFDAATGVDLRPERRRIGYVFQDALLFPHLTVHANLVYGQRLRAASERFIDEDRVVELLGLGALLRRKPGALSGGERQRVAIGRALLAQPRMLLMDEPLASLDVARRIEILDYVARLRAELAIPIVYVTHSVSEIARLADTVVVLSEGRCLAVGAVEDVMGRVDVGSATDRYEAGSLVDTRVKSHQPQHQLTTLAFDGGVLHVPRVDARVGDRLRARIRARDVSLALRRPEGISVLNILPARIAAIHAETGPIVEVQLGVGAATFTAAVTRRSLAELDLHVGQEILALVKAVSFDAQGIGYAAGSVS